MSNQGVFYKKESKMQDAQVMYRRVIESKKKATENRASSQDVSLSSCESLAG